MASDIHLETCGIQHSENHLQEHCDEVRVVVSAHTHAQERAVVVTSHHVAIAHLLQKNKGLTQHIVTSSLRPHALLVA